MAGSIIRQWRKKEAGALLFGLCVLFALSSLYPSDESFGEGDGRRHLLMVMDDVEDDPLTPEMHRFLQAKNERRNKRAHRRQKERQRVRNLERRTADAGPEEEGEESTGIIYDWAENNLYPLNVHSSPGEVAAPLFWHIPKSGGTTAKAIYECFDLTLVNRAGALPRFGHDKDTELLAYRPWGNRGPAYVNQDTTSKEGILKAAKLGLIESGLGDIIFTAYPSFAIDSLYNENHKGRAFGLFRHPVDRLVSKFYYLQKATWERTYRPEWKHVGILKFAKELNFDNNSYVKQLSGKRMGDTVNETDLQFAIETVKERFVVGLMDHMEESIRRFNVYMGIDTDGSELGHKCMNKYFGEHSEVKNSNSHKKLEPGDDAYRILAEKNSFDIQLYEVVLSLFEEQRAVVEAYAQSASTPAQEEEEEPPAPDEDAPATAEARERRRNLAQGASKKVVLAEAREQHRLLVKD